MVFFFFYVRLVRLIGLIGKRVRVFFDLMLKYGFVRLIVIKMKGNLNIFLIGWCFLWNLKLFLDVKGFFLKFLSMRLRIL